MKMSWVFGFLDLAWTKGLDLGPVGTGNWGLGLGLDKKYRETKREIKKILSFHFYLKMMLLEG